MRASGILLPVSSLWSRYGIGGFTGEAYDWIDFLKKCGQTFWQILPMGHTGFGDSPYQTFSSAAGNPYFVSLEDLIAQGLLSRGECDAAGLEGDPTRVDYGAQFERRYPLLRKAYERDRENDQTGFEAFWEQEADWLPDYALFMSIKDLHGKRAWSEWGEAYKKRDPDTMRAAREDLADSISFHAHIQYWFMDQWGRLKAYANKQGIRIIGDQAIYVALDSADTWTCPRLFQFNKTLDPIAVAGCPPDFFSEDGQLWGNPLYDWERHKETGYAWWVRRIRRASRLYDAIRFDHFRGLDEYYAVPFGEATARNGRWLSGPGMDLIRTIRDNVPGLEIIAEDLGMITDSVRELLRESGFPGMKVLEFAFDGDCRNAFLPHNYDTTNCVVYTATHDNETLMQFIAGAPEKIRENMKRYLNRHWDTDSQLCDNLIRLAMQSTAKYCVTPMQDYLRLGGDARMNFPSRLGGNWEWRLRGDQVDDCLAERIGEITGTYGRWPEASADEKPGE